MVLDTSAVVAVLFDETERRAFNERIATAPVRLLSAVSRVELTCVVEGRKREQGRADLERFLAEAQIQLVDVNRSHVDLACEAFRRYGRGRHPAALNIGDCFAYALAKATGEPLLYSGDDFSRTDIASAVR
jgi:ribonuclease VapC